MKKIYILFFVLTSIMSQSQNFDWAIREGWWAYDYGYGVATDLNGNIYVAGKYEDTAHFSGTTLTCAGNHDSYLASYSPSGALNWIRTSGGVFGDYAHAIACDGSNYVYMAGEIEGWGHPITFSGSSTVITSYGDNDAYVAKYDLNGNLIWARAVGGNGSERALGVAYDNQGNVFIAGHFEDTAYFNGVPRYSIGDKDLFLAKYDANGNLLWVQNAGSPRRDEAKGVVCDASGNAYITGMVHDSAVFGAQILTSPNDYFNIYVAKYDANGNQIWVKNAGGDVDDVGWGITIDSSGKLYVTGEYNAYAVFDSHWLLSNGNADVFVACYDQAGNTLWASGAGGPLIDRARGIGTNGTNIYVTGQFGASMNVGTTTLNAADSTDIFMAGLDNAGSFTWAASVGGDPDSLETLSYESGNSITGDTFGNVYVTGALLNGGIFGSNTVSQYSRTDVFLTKISQVNSITAPKSKKDKLSVYPNPSRFQFTVESELLDGVPSTITVYNSFGQIVRQITTSASKQVINTYDLSKGMYYLEISNAKAVAREKVIIQ